MEKIQIEKSQGGMEMSQEQIDLCLIIAKKAHVNQTRRGGEPYIIHPQRVAKTFEGGCSVCYCVALLHDVIEDSSLEIEDLLELGVDPSVAWSVFDLTKVEGQEYEEYLKHVKMNPVAKKVKVADMLDNLLSDPTDKQVKKYSKGLKFLLF